ncbi:hypothetical protein ROT00_03660 [Agromyces mediolanus]|uniref:hypothetical protein n=1 Tax=Agromyces mediolanus TaxID=41986 RepID=UPI0038344A21
MRPDPDEGGGDAEEQDRALEDERGGRPRERGEQHAVERPQQPDGGAEVADGGRDRGEQRGRERPLHRRAEARDQHEQSERERTQERPDGGDPGRERDRHGDREEHDDRDDRREEQVPRDELLVADAVERESGRDARRVPEAVGDRAEPSEQRRPRGGPHQPAGRGGKEREGQERAGRGDGEDSGGEASGRPGRPDRVADEEHGRRPPERPDGAEPPAEPRPALIDRDGRAEVHAARVGGRRVPAGGLGQQRAEAARGGRRSSSPATTLPTSRRSPIVSTRSAGARSRNARRLHRAEAGAVGPVRSAARPAPERRKSSRGRIPSRVAYTSGQ